MFLEVFPFLDDFLAQLLIFGRFLFAARHHLEQLVGVILHLDRAVMQDHDGRFEPRCHLDGFAGVTQRVFAFRRPLRGQAVQVRRGIIDADGQGTEIMQAGDFHFPGRDGIEDARQEADARAVAQFGVFKAQVADLAEHRAAIGVAV
jgi:hypothetical protein